MKHFFFPCAAAMLLAVTFGCRSAAPVCETVTPERIGVCSWSFAEPLADVARDMEAMDVRGIQLAVGPFIAADGRHGEAETAEAWQQVKARQASGRWNIMSTMIAFPQEDYTTLESIRKTGGIVPNACWPKNKAIFAKAVELSAELKVKYLSCHAGFLDLNDTGAYKTFCERLTWMRDTCAKAGIMLLLESGQETADHLVRLMKAVPGIGINFDPANMILYGKGRPMEAMVTLMPWIRQIHVKDAVETKVPGTWGTEVPWGEGEAGGRAFVAKMHALGYTGNFVIEREGGNRRAEDIALAARRLKK